MSTNKTMVLQKVLPSSKLLLPLLTVFGLLACSKSVEQDNVQSNPLDVSWNQIEERAKEQSVYWNAWGGDPRVNAYIDWVSEQVEQRFEVDLIHVKLNDTAEAVSRILSERAAGREQGGSVDLIWINGENFADLKANQMLFGPLSSKLPNFYWVDHSQPAFVKDFTIDVDELQVPWGLSTLVWLYNSDAVASPPQSAKEMLDWASKNPGRLTYPAPPNFVGSSFLKQLLIEFTRDKERLSKPVSDNATYLADPVFEYLEQLHPFLWRSGNSFPVSAEALKQLLADNEVDFSLNFNPAEGISGILSGQLPETTRTYTMDTGALTNGHFVAIPSNANSKEGAMVVANFLLSSEAQARKADIRTWGDASSLDIEKLGPTEKRLFTALRRDSLLINVDLDASLAEPHPSWTKYLERLWLERFSR
jgi:putative thiamine transport system substrate-binding protein